MEQSELERQLHDALLHIDRLEHKIKFLEGKLDQIEDITRGNQITIQRASGAMLAVLGVIGAIAAAWSFAIAFIKQAVGK